MDDDCDTRVDADDPDLTDGYSGYADADGDGYGSTTPAISCESGVVVADDTDCDDTNTTIHPSAPEVCDGVDDDCDTLVDVDDPNLTDGYAGYTDSDGDGYGSATPAISCEPDGVVADDSDCDDTNAATHPSAPELCNGADDDCDSLVDLDDPGLTDAWSGYADSDGDGYGSTTPAISCAPDGVVASSTDCDDSNATVYPDAPDAAVDGTDQDCDGFDGPDMDGDGYADGAAGGEDCDDTDPSVNPGAGDGLTSDRNCDGVVFDGDLADASFKFVGEDAYDYAGYSVSSAGDVDGDGLADLLVGAYGDDDGGDSAGAAYVVLGSSLGTSRTIDLSAAEYKLQGEDADDYAGYSVSSAGDVDGDGLADLLVGAVHDDGGGSNAGAAYVVLGSSLGASRTIDLSAARYKLVGEDASDGAGYSVSSAGDVDGDGLADLLVGAYGDDDGGSGAGAAYVVLGSSLGAWRTIDLSTADYKLVGEDASDNAGFSVSSAGDVDGDGLGDLLVGADGDDDGGTGAGAVYVVLASSLGSSRTIDLSAADYKFVGEDADDHAGSSVSSAGDVDGDGLADLLVGAPYNDDGGTYAGAAYVVLGSSLGAARTVDLSAADYKLVGEDDRDFAGSSVSSAGDVDGDGLDDLLVGAYGGSDAGAAYLVLGWSLGASRTIDLSAANYKLVGEDSYDRAGESVSSAGDVNGDGRDDLLVGAWGDDDGGESAGAAYLLLGG